MLCQIPSFWAWRNIRLKPSLIKKVLQNEVYLKALHWLREIDGNIYIFFNVSATRLLCSEAFVRRILAIATRQVCVLAHKAPVEDCSHRQHAFPGGSGVHQKLAVVP